MSRHTYYSGYVTRTNYYSSINITNVISEVSSSDYVNFIAGENLITADIVFIKDDGKVYRTTALSQSGSYSIGFAISGGLGGSTIPIDTRYGKVITYLSGLSIGQRYYLSESYGQMSTTIPQNKNSLVYFVGIAKTENDFIFTPQLLLVK